MGYLDYAGLQYLWGKLKEKFAPKSHSHDDRYYTEAEMDGKLNSKVNNNEAGADSLLSKLTTSWTATPTDNTYFIRQDTGGGDSFGRVKFSTLWNYIKGKTDGVYQPKGSYAASGHTHDDRYYTESEMNTKLSGKSNTDHTHKNVNDIGSNKPTTFAYSKSGMNYGDYSWLAGWNGYELRAVNKNQFAIADHTHPTSEIYGGNVNYSGYAGPIESAHIDVLRANRLAFLPASGIKVEYSVDGGATWIDYGATDDQKASLFAMRMGSAASFYTGKHTKAAECTTKDQLRITVTPVDRYASVNMLYLWVSVAGTSATVNISRSTIGAKETFTDVRTDVPISGWSGPNEIRFSDGTFGGGSTQTSNAYAYRFTFKNKADGKGSVSVMDIRMYGPSAWGVPNSMMEKDHIYNWDVNQNVQFPAQVTATKFNGSSTGVVDYGNAAGATIKVGFNGAGLTKDNLTHIAGYAKDGNQTVIKDVSRGVLQSWLNLNEMINTQLTTSSSTPSDNDFYISQYAGGGATTTTYHRRPVSALWNYIKGKTDGVYQPKGSYAASGHTHDDRYYTESEMNTKLSGKSNTDHTHKNVNDIGSNKPTTFAYSKSGMNYGDYSWLAGWNGYELRAVNKNQFAIADHTHPTSEIYGGNVNYSGYAGPIESAHIDVLRANRLAFLPASGIKVEYSVDGGATWIDYGATDDQKASLFAMRMGSAASFYTGKHTKAAECTTKDQLRITVTPVDRYASVNMLYLWVSVAGTSATVNISRSTIGAKETFTDVRTDVPISGWSGPNEIRFSDGTFGGGSTQTSNAYAYRFTFKNKADGKGSVSVMDIRMYGPSAWGVPNSMMEKDHIYNWDVNQNVQFPAQVTATKFNGSSTGVVDYGNAAGATIKVGFNGAGLTKDNLTHIAGYAKDGNQTVIKDVSRGVLQSWLNLNEMINTQLTTSSSTPSDNDFYISQYAGGGATTTTYHRRPVSALWSYIKSKADAVYSAKSHTHTKSQITDFPASLKNPTALTIQTNGTTAAIYDGSAAKTVNIMKSNIGLGNVDNTADANKSVKYATSAGNASKVNNHTVNIDVPANAKFTDTTYGMATASSNGLMSSTDKTKLDDFSRVISIQKQIKLTTDWQDTGIAGNNLETGTYIIQVSGFNSSYTSLYNEVYSGIMTWYASETNDLNNDEIFLHNAGHASNSNDIYLRTSRRLYSNGGLHLQIACKVAASGTDTLTFKFRRLI